MSKLGCNLAVKMRRQCRCHLLVLSAMKLGARTDLARWSWHRVGRNPTPQLAAPGFTEPQTNPCCWILPSLLFDVPSISISSIKNPYVCRYSWSSRGVPSLSGCLALKKTLLYHTQQSPIPQKKKLYSRLSHSLCPKTICLTIWMPSSTQHTRKQRNRKRRRHRPKVKTPLHLSLSDKEPASADQFVLQLHHDLGKRPSPGGRSGVVGVVVGVVRSVV